MMHVELKVSREPTLRKIRRAHPARSHPTPPKRKELCMKPRARRIKDLQPIRPDPLHERPQRVRLREVQVGRGQDPDLPTTRKEGLKLMDNQPKPRESRESHGQVSLLGPAQLIAQHVQKPHPVRVIRSDPRL